MRLYYAAMVAAAAAGAASASGPWPLPFFTAAPGEVLAEAAKINPPDARDLALLDSDCAMKINEQGRAFTTCRFLFRPVSAAGASQLGAFQVPWTEWREQRPALRIRVISPDALANELDPSKITIASGDTKVLEAQLPPVAVNSVVEIETISQDREVLIAGSRFAYFQPDNLATGHWRASVEVPAAMPLRVKAERLPGARRTETHSGPTQKVVIEISDLPVRKEQVALPPEDSPPPRVAVSAGLGWDAIAAAYSQILEGSIGVPAPRFGAPETARAGSIATALSAIRSALALSKQDLGPASFVPPPVRDIIARRQANSLELAVALAARLRSFEIPAYVALLTPYEGPDAEADLPGLEAFTNAIVYVPGRQPFWIDPSSPFTPANRLPVQDQGRMALIVRPMPNALVRTPVSEASENRFTEYQNITLEDKGPGVIEEIEEGEGYFADVFRLTGSALKSATPQQLEPYEKSLASAYGFEKTTQTGVENLEDASKPIRLVFRGTGYKNASTDESAATVSIPEIAANGAVAGGVLNRLIAAASEDSGRTQSFFVMPRCIVERRVHIAPPSGYRLRELPSLGPTALGPLTLHREAALAADGAVDVVYHLEIARDRFTPEEARAIAAAIGRLSALPMIPVEFVVNSLDRLIAARDYARAASLLPHGSPDAAVLVHTRRNEDIRNSDDPLIATVQQLIRGLLDPRGQRPWRIYYDDHANPSLEAERAHLLDVLVGFRTAGGVTLGLDGVADVALSNLQLSYDGSGEKGYRVRFPDPARGGAMSTLGRFVKSGDSYRVLGIGEAPPIR
jgi:hypothetical protein